MTTDTMPEAVNEETLTEEFGISNEDLSNASQGKFKHTMLEMWEAALNNLILQSSGPIGLDIAASILQSYPWLNHNDLFKYQKDRIQRFEEARERLYLVLGDDKEKIYSENENDWLLHSELYIQVVASWNNMARLWEAEWSKKPAKVSHATIADVTAMILNENFGIIESLKNLADFEMTDELKELMNELLGLKVADNG